MAFTSFSCHSSSSTSHLRKWKDLRGFAIKPYTPTFFPSVIKLAKFSIVTNRCIQARDGVDVNATVANNTIADVNDKLISIDESNLNRLVEEFSSIEEAIEDIRQGKMVVVVDDENLNKGGLIMAAEAATTEAMAFMEKHGTGIVYVGMKREDLERLETLLMVDITAGVSSEDRAATAVALASRHSKPSDFKQLGHILPLRYTEGGVLKRPGRAEASVDLARLAGLNSVGILSEIVIDNELGPTARLSKLRQFVNHHSLKIISIADLIRYRRKKEISIERVGAPTRMPTTWGTFNAYCYKSTLDGIEHIAMVMGDVSNGEDILVRVHSECFTGDIFGSTRCDCGKQLALAMQQIKAAKKGVLVYLRGQEGRGIGLGNKLLAYNLQDAGRDTVEANEDLGLPIDSRDYSVGAQILRDLGVRTMRLMTNNPTKYIGLKGYGLGVSGRVPLVTPITKDNKRYLETKRAKMGHVYGLEFNGEFRNPNGCQ
ncbi:Bifunctional riboflavin biosynthesis protein RIBA 1, chloroplastic, partial [Cucurbita argyrosperma subsp. sororia]